MNQPIMTKSRRTHKWIATFFLAIFLPTLAPINTLYAANNGPNAPEAASFEPIDATDMVSLATGDMAYMLPLLNVPSPEGGYPIALSYHGGIGYEQEASMVGLGWNLNPGAINRNVNGVPDDWNGALVRDKSYFKAWGKSVDLSAGWGNFDVALAYSWDSNGTKKGSVGIGYGGGNARIGVGASYSNKSGMGGNINAGVGSNGFGIGVYADTDGLMAIGGGYSIGFGNENMATSMSVVGFSLTSNKGKVGAGLNAGGVSIMNTNSGSASSSSFGFSAGIYYAGFFVKVGYSESTFSRDKLDEDYIYGPLYYKNLSQNPEAGVVGQTYRSTIQNEHNRDRFMDTYKQAVPSIESTIAPLTVFNEQKNSYNAPAYDNYEVNAQGISGNMTPRLLTNGLLINPGADIEYKEEVVSEYACAWETCGSQGGQLAECNCFIPPHPLHCFLNEKWGRKIRTNRMYVNSHFATATQSNQRFNNTFGNVGNSHFYFNYQFPSNLVVNPATLTPSNNTNSITSSFNLTGSTPVVGRSENSDYIETFTNGQIGSAVANGSFLEAKNYDRTNDPGYRSDGIGGYKITTNDGKTYHYSRPVYQFEQFFRQLMPDPDDPTQSESENDYYREVRKTEPYATHWLLTAVTGPDFVKMSNSPYPDEGDYGYWVRFDYGKWTDGYNWRTPTIGYDNMSLYNNSRSDQYSWGRKQLVYLDKVVTRTHTALFVKSIRQDDKGAVIGGGNFPSYEGDGGVNYPSQRSLKLDEIILLKNDDYSLANNHVNANTQVNSITNEQTSNTVNWTSMNDITYSMNQQNQVIDIGDFTINTTTGKPLIYNVAQKIIKLNQDYVLGRGTPNSSAPPAPSLPSSIGQGRLTLQGVEVLARGGESFMPSYSFDYIDENVAYNAVSAHVDKDDWGYRKNNPALWTLNKIHTPTGSTIELEYEPDEYYTEAFARKLFNENDLNFLLYQDYQGEYVIEYRRRSLAPDTFNFLDYFSATDPVWSQLYCCHSVADNWPTNTGERRWFHMNGKYPLSIKSVSSTNVIIRIPPFDGGDNCNSNDFTGVTDGGWFRGISEWRCYLGTDCADNSNHSAWVFNYKLMANKVPPAGSGGGLRVKSIKSIADGTVMFATNYAYNHPTKNRTSGITSFAPTKDKKYVAYRSEIPSPRVIYEYVTLTEKGGNNDFLGKTQYQFNVLPSDFNVFDPNLRAGNHFKSTVSINTINLNRATTGVDVKLEDNFATLGSIIKVTQINKAGQVMSQLKNDVITLEQLADDNDVDKPGKLQESFHSFTSIYNYEKNWMAGNANLGFISWSETCTGQEHFLLNKRLATTSTKITYPLVQRRKTEIVGNNKQVTEYKNIDLKTGLFLESYTTLADGTLVKTESVPARKKYNQMDSKVGSPSNKHMLTQEAMNITSIYKGNLWKTINANLTTWNKDWSYRDNLGIEDIISTDVWRKHKSFVWKQPTDTDGSYLQIVSNQNNSNIYNHFDWQNSTPLPYSSWQKVSEITRYNHFSNPLEIKDINNNFASSKMADNNTKTIVSGNARYTEMYYSGAEYVAQGNYFEGEVQGAGFRSDEAAHTGDYSVKVTSPTHHIFEVNGLSGPSNYFTNPNNYTQAFRPGKYKVSFWALNNMDPAKGTQLILNGNSMPLSETVIAGCWKQFNYYIDIPPNATNTLYIKNYLIGGEASEYYYDDFRLHPITSSITSYVYDHVTDELSYTLDSNNMGTAYKYDNAGRLLATYVETEDVNYQLNASQLAVQYTGGFKITSQYKQKYKNSNDVSIPALGTINNCLTNIDESKMEATIADEYLTSFENGFTTKVRGGSGNFNYKYKWLVNAATNTYSNYVTGEETQAIPCAINYCSGEDYDKLWSFVVKVTDLETGNLIEESYRYKTGDCKFNSSIWSDIQITKSNPQCGADKYNFKLHLKDISKVGNFLYEFAYYDPALEFENQDYVDINDTDGKFCPDWTRYEDSGSETGYRDYLNLVYRITNLSTGEKSSVNMHFIGDASSSDATYPVVPPNDITSKHKESGMLIKLDEKENVLEISNVNQIVR